MLTSFVNDLSSLALSLREGKKELFSAPLHWTILSNGDADFHDNVIFFGFEANKSDPVLVAKVSRLIENGWMLKAEYEHLAELWNCIGEDAESYVPKPYAMTTLQERPVLVISYASGESLARLSPKSFWTDSKQVLALAKEAAHSLRNLNRLTERPIEKVESKTLRFLEKAEKFRDLFKISGEEEHALMTLVEKVNICTKLAEHKVLIQGDFWHGNMIRDKKRKSLMFVDWQFARWSVDVSMDVYFFLLAGALAATENETIEQHAKDAFRLLNEWRKDIIPEYLFAYGVPEYYVLLPQKYGMMMCCVEKAVRSALEFGYSHPDDIVWRSLFAELINWSNEDSLGISDSIEQTSKPGTQL
ncbi:MAG TPA: aminoglycoside phosphotransferase family protein [Anaerolineales bacterium]|nr:aminoglycoside phosphotransferase family protein [Anaerolineales bacterium]